MGNLRIYDCFLTLNFVLSISLCNLLSPLPSLSSPIISSGPIRFISPTLSSRSLFSRVNFSVSRSNRRFLDSSCEVEIWLSNSKLLSRFSSFLLPSSGIFKGSLELFLLVQDVIFERSLSSVTFFSKSIDILGFFGGSTVGFTISDL